MYEWVMMLLCMRRVRDEMSLVMDWCPGGWNPVFCGGLEFLFVMLRPVECVLAAIGTT